jgi:chemotaxis protein methyltransferase CheR
MVTHRLQTWIGDQGFKNFQDYLDHVKMDLKGTALMALANRLTTNYSYFYREAEQLEFFLKQALPQKNTQTVSPGNSTLNVWSAGCASGEEPYSIAMLMNEYFNSTFVQWDLGILATDLDTLILKEAYKGVYREERLSKLPSQLKIKYMNQNESGLWEINESLKKMIHFTRYNLIRDQFSFKNKFFAVFCRNVMIYFDQQTINSLVERFYDVLENDGYLFIGQTESLDKSKTRFKYVAPSIYQKSE